MILRNTPTRVAAAVVLALVLAACGGKPPAPDSSPVAPSATPAAPTTVTGGATVSGTVAVSSSSAGLTAGNNFRGLLDTTYSIVVSVEGTSLSTVADGAGRFKLTGVPSGTVQLKFSGNGMQGSITLTGVKDADDISVSVTLTSAGASMDNSQQSDPAGTVQLEGRISAVAPGGVANALTVDATLVTIGDKTVIRHGSTDLKIGDLHVGDRVHVKGTKNGQGIAATEVMLQSDNVAVPVNLNGTVTELIGGFKCPSIRFVLQGWTVETDTNTSFQKAECGAVSKGASVHVKGTVQSSDRVLATWVQIGK